MPIKLCLTLAVVASIVFTSKMVLADGVQTANPSTVAPTTAAAPAAASKSVDPIKNGLIEQMLKVMKTEEQSKQLADAILSQSPAIVEQILPIDPNLTPDQEKAAEDKATKAVDRFQELFKEQIDIPTIVRSVTYELYDKYFTADEIKDLIAFYKTSTGQKAVNILPQLSQESMKLTDDALAPQIRSIVKQMQDEDKAGKAPAATK